MRSASNRFGLSKLDGRTDGQRGWSSGRGGRVSLWCLSTSYVLLRTRPEDVGFLFVGTEPEQLQQHPAGARRRKKGFEPARRAFSEK